MHHMFGIGTVLMPFNLILKFDVFSLGGGVLHRVYRPWWPDWGVLGAGEKDAVQCCFSTSVSSTLLVQQSYWVKEYSVYYKQQCSCM